MLTELQTSGGVDIIFETPLNAENFKVTMSGGSDIKNLSLNCHSFKGVFSGDPMPKSDFCRPM